MRGFNIYEFVNLVIVIWSVSNCVNVDLWIRRIVNQSIRRDELIPESPH